VLSSFGFISSNVLPYVLGAALFFVLGFNQSLSGFLVASALSVAAFIFHFVKYRKKADSRWEKSGRAGEAIFGSLQALWLFSISFAFEPGWLVYVFAAAAVFFIPVFPGRLAGIWPSVFVFLLCLLTLLGPGQPLQAFYHLSLTPGFHFQDAVVSGILVAAGLYVLAGKRYLGALPLFVPFLLYPAEKALGVDFLLAFVLFFPGRPQNPLASILSVLLFALQKWIAPLQEDVFLNAAGLILLSELTTGGLELAAGVFRRRTLRTGE